MGIIKKKSGVYEIRYFANGKSYVGSTRNLISRRAEKQLMERRKRTAKATTHKQRSEATLRGWITRRNLLCVA